MKTQHKHLIIGMLLGLILPLIVGYIIILTRNGLDIDIMRYSIVSFVPFIQLGAIGNLAIFFLFNWLDKPAIQRGIIGATIIYVMIIFGLKFFY